MYHSYSRLHFSFLMVSIITSVLLLELPTIPSEFQGPIATIVVVIFSITTRLGLFKTAQNSGPDLAFCAVGLQLAFFYKKVEQPITPEGTLIGWDMIFLIGFITVWMVCLIFVKQAPNAKVRLRYINPYSVVAGVLGFLSILSQMYWRLLCL